MNYIYSARDPALPSLLCVVIYSPRAKSQEALGAGGSWQVTGAAAAATAILPPTPLRDLLPAVLTPASSGTLSQQPCLPHPSGTFSQHYPTSVSWPESAAFPEAAAVPMVVPPLPGGGSQLFQVVFEHHKLPPPAASQQSRLSVG